MLNIYRKVYSLLDARERRRALLMFMLMLLVAVSEVVGVASVLPFIAVLANPEVIQTNKYLAWAYDAFGFTTQRGFLLGLGAAFFVMLVGSLILKAMGLWGQLRFSQNRSLTWTHRLIAAYLRQPYDWFLNRHSADLATSILAEVDIVVNQALVPAMQSIAHLMISVLLLSLLVAVDPMLALSVGIVLGGGYAAVAVALRNRMRAVGEERRKANRARFRVVHEAFGGIKDVKISGLEERMLDRFRIPSEVRSERVIAAGLYQALPSFVMQALLFGGMMLVLLYLISAKGSFSDALPIMSLYALAGYKLMPAVQKVFEETSKLRSSETAVDSLAEDLHKLEQSAVVHARSRRGEPAQPRLALREALELSAIFYKYPSAERNAADGVSLRIPAFHSIGLVGSTGSGKTTLVDIILGLLSPLSGELLVDGTSVNGTNVRAWQRSLGYVPQQIFLADETVAGNIAFGLPAALIDMEAVERAAKIANLHDFVVSDMPQGYATRVGERGVRLSGGQRQRIGIARALYHDPDVLIMDEATSALDNLTEHAVMEAVRNLTHRKTIIMIAHRLSTVRHCDTIYLLEHGRLIGEGTYDELRETNERFRLLAETA